MPSLALHVPDLGLIRVSSKNDVSLGKFANISRISVMTTGRPYYGYLVPCVLSCSKIL
jgi:hypothetical protein